ncbi:MAG: hypothetical protein KJZ93_30570 [Caldilineaceae bacterium]|nr:hypothetical protein [Caldilineaceae bacterium]
MAKTNLIAFRATPDQRRKLERLATGERTTISGILAKLIDNQPVQPIQVAGLKMPTTDATESHAGAVPTP